MQCNFIRGVVEARTPADEDLVAPQVKIIQERFGKTSLSGICPVGTDDNPLPIRGPFGEAEIWFKLDAVPSIWNHIT